MEAHDRKAIQAAVNRLADAIDPEAVGIEIGDLVIREIPELARYPRLQAEPAYGAAR